MFEFYMLYTVKIIYLSKLINVHSMIRIIFCLLMIVGVSHISYAQKSKAPNPANAPQLDQKKMAKANTLISQAMKEKDKGKQSELLNNALELYREMKMFKEGNIAVGDAFYNQGDLKSASRYYAKGGKENKAETNEKVGKAYLEDAFKETDPKLQKKAFDNAFKTLSKAHGAAEANRMIGNEFFDMGMDYYPQALDYYEKAGYHEGVFMIGDLYSAKPENIEQAANTYVRTKQREGYKKAGDLYYNKGDLVKSMEYYATGGVIEGYKKFAVELKKADKIKEYNTVVEIITDTLRKRNDLDGVREYAVQAERDNNYVLAGSLYGKLGETKLEKQYAAYNHMMGLEVIPAKEIFKTNGNQDIADDIDRNIKVLTDIQQNMFVLKELEKNIPKVASKVNPHTGELEYDKNDLKLRSQYYGNPVNQKSISDVVYSIGTSYAKLKGNAKLLGLVREAMLRFKPVKNILDNYDFSKKIIPINITPAAVTF